MDVTVYYDDRDEHKFTDVDSIDHFDTGITMVDGIMHTGTTGVMIEG